MALSPRIKDHFLNINLIQGLQSASPESSFHLGHCFFFFLVCSKSAWRCSCADLGWCLSELFLGPGVPSQSAFSCGTFSHANTSNSAEGTPQLTSNGAKVLLIYEMQKCVMSNRSSDGTMKDRLVTAAFFDSGFQEAVAAWPYLPISENATWILVHDEMYNLHYGIYCLRVSSVK